MREIHAAIERFDAAIARLEAAMNERPAPAADNENPATVIERLRRENEALRAARAREAALRAAALKRVDVAIAALEAALSSKAGVAKPEGRSRAMFGEDAGAVEPAPTAAKSGQRQGRAAAG